MTTACRRRAWRREIGAALGGRALEGRQVDERLEHRSGLAPRADRTVVLRLVVRAPADQRQDFAGARVDGDERGLGAARPLAARQELVDVRQPVAQARPAPAAADGGRASCRRSSGAVACVTPGILLGERLADIVDEVGRLRLERPLHDLNRLARCRRAASSETKPSSAIARSTTLRRSRQRSGERKRRPGVRRLNDAGDRRRLAQRHVADVLAEEEARSLGDAVHRERAALPEVDVVQVHLEDLILRDPALEDERHVLFGQLAAQRLLRRQEEVLHQLLRDGAAADQVLLLAAQVRDHRADGANQIDAGVVVEAAVLDGEDGLDHARRNGRERHLPTLLAARADERGERAADRA